MLANSADNWGGATTIVPGATLQLGDGVANTIIPANSISNSGTLAILNSSPGTISASITGTGTFYAFGSSVLTLNGNNSAGDFYANGGTVNINGSFSTTGKTVFGSNLATAPLGPTVVNWNATGSATGGSFFGVADTGQTATLNIVGGNLAVTDPVFIGNTNGGGVGTLNVSAGTVAVSGGNGFFIGDINTSNANSTGIVNISGGQLSIASGGTVATPGGNNAITMADGSNSSATINLTGGVLATGRSFVLGGGATATLNLNGGTLQGTATNANWFQGVTVVAGAGGAIIDTQGNTMTVSSLASIDGPGSLTKNGVGSLSLNGVNNYQGGTVINNGLVMAQSELSLGPVPASFMPNNITLNGGELRDASNGGSLFLSANRGVLLGPAGGVLRAGWSNTTTVTDVISGASLTIANDGQGFSPPSNVYLANTANTYTGSTTIGGGALPSTYDFEGLSSLNVPHLADGSQSSSIGASSSAAANLVFNSFNSAFPSSGGTGNLNYVGAGDSTNRLFTIASGIAAINSSGAGPLNFTNPGAIAFTNPLPSTLALGGTYVGSTPNTFAPQIADGGGGPTTLAVNGSLWTLTGTNNTYSGGTVLSGGTLNVTGNNVLQNSVVSLKGGSLAFAAGVTSPAVAGLSGNGSGIVLQDANSSPVTLNVGGNGASSTFAGNLSGLGGLVKTGSGLFVLAASQSYNGATAISGGTLQFVAPIFVSGFGGNGTGWTFSNSGNAACGVSGNTATLTLSGTGNTRSSVWNNTQLPLSGTPWTATFTYTPSFSGGGGADGSAFVVQSSGVGALGGNGTATSGFGNTMGFSGISPSAGVTMQIFGASFVNVVTSPAAGANLENAGINTVSGGIDLRTGGTNFTVSYDGNSTLNVSATQGANVFSHAFALNLGSVFGGTTGGVYFGFTGADGGTTSTQKISNFTLATAPGLNELPINTALQVNGVFDLSGGSQAVGSLAGSGTVANSAAQYTAALTLGSDGSNQTFSGAITGNLALTKVGGGTEILSGTNTFTGGTTVAGGALIVTNNEALEDGSNLIVGNGSSFSAAVVPSPPASGFPATAGAAVAPVPEPGALALLAAGAVAAAFAAGRRRRR